MKIWTRIVVLMLMLASMVLLTGCGEEEKYNTAKNEVVKMEQEWNQIDTKLENEDKHKEMTDQINKKMADMESVAKSKTALNNDLLQLKEKVKDEDERWNAGLREEKYIKEVEASMEKNSYSNKLDNPWEQYNQFGN